MYISSLTLQSFRNYTQATLQGTPGLTCLYGLNGAGKTNLLEAIHYVCTARSALFCEDTTLLQTGAPHFVLKAQVHTPSQAVLPKELLVSYMPGKKKRLQIDEQHYLQRNGYAAHIPALMIAPGDIERLQSSSQARRDFMDALLLQEDANYRTQWLTYRGYLRARNAALKAPLSGKRVDKTLLLSYDEYMLPLAQQIAIRRQAFMQDYVRPFQEKYRALAGNAETVQIAYSSKVLDKDFVDCYQAAYNGDVQLMRTQMGIHQDDYLFQLQGQPLRGYASQGQLKSFLWALKLTHVQCLYTLKKQMPILLLDDIFDKLDSTRTRRLLELLLAPQGAQPVSLMEMQLFLTSPRPPSSALFPAELSDFQLVHIKDGQLHHE